MTRTELPAVSSLLPRMAVLSFHSGGAERGRRHLPLRAATGDMESARVRWLVCVCVAVN